MILITIKDLVTGLARNPEFTAEKAHRLAFQQASHEPKALVHHRTLFPRHRHFPPAIAGGKCHPSVRYELSPMSRAAHPLSQPLLAIARASPRAMPRRVRMVSENGRSHRREEITDRATLTLSRLPICAYVSPVHWRERRDLPSRHRRSKRRGPVPSVRAPPE